MSKKKNDPPASETARKIWLAGIGAYGRAFSEAQESLARVGDETSKIFDELVERGEEIEKTVEEKGRQVAARVSPGAVSFEDRIKKMRARLGLSPFGDHEQGGAESSGAAVDEILTRLELIEAKVDLLAQRLDDTPSTRRRSPKKSAKPAAKKSVKKSVKKKKA